VVYAASKTIQQVNPLFENLKNIFIHDLKKLELIISSEGSVIKDVKVCEKIKQNTINALLNIRISKPESL
jgi:hypothetical protein